uniref:CKLF-like MARVEL transmembrane domain containing 8b n=1 Tax=Salarias fasciatus TaxID=181472 RepID=A0A672F6P5_SALFA
ESIWEERESVSHNQNTLAAASEVCGMLVWILVGGTDYFHLSALCWVMFSSILLWILTVFLFIIYLAGVHHRIPRVPWTTLDLCMHCSATVLYLVTAVVNALSVKQATRGRHNYNCWAASAVSLFQRTVFKCDKKRLKKGCLEFSKQK